MKYDDEQKGVNDKKQKRVHERPEKAEIRPSVLRFKLFKG
jgi:hypothetical protein